MSLSIGKFLVLSDLFVVLSLGMILKSFLVSSALFMSLSLIFLGMCISEQVIVRILKRKKRAHPSENVLSLFY